MLIFKILSETALNTRTKTYTYICKHKYIHTNKYMFQYLILSWTALKASALPVMLSTHTNSTLGLSEFPYSDKNCDSCVWYSLGAAIYISDLWMSKLLSSLLSSFLLSSFKIDCSNWSESCYKYIYVWYPNNYYHHCYCSQYYNHHDNHYDHCHNQLISRYKNFITSFWEVILWDFMIFYTSM